MVVVLSLDLLGGLSNIQMLVNYGSQQNLNHVLTQVREVPHAESNLLPRPPFPAPAGDVSWESLPSILLRCH